VIMKENTQLLNDFFNELPEVYQEMFKDIADYTISLGYTPKKTKSKNFAIDFSKSKVKRTILKLEIHENANQENPPGLRLKFYASKEYSDIFKNSVQKVIEEFNGKYTGCYGCGRCKRELEGYNFTYSNGTSVFRCGNELISIHNFSSKNVPEIKSLIKVQDEFFTSSI